MISRLELAKGALSTHPGYHQRPVSNPCSEGHLPLRICHSYPRPTAQPNRIIVLRGGEGLVVTYHASR